MFKSLPSSCTSSRTCQQRQQETSYPQPQLQEVSNSEVTHCLDLQGWQASDPGYAKVWKLTVSELLENAQSGINSAASKVICRLPTLYRVWQKCCQPFGDLSRANEISDSTRLVPWTHAVLAQKCWGPHAFWKHHQLGRKPEPRTHLPASISPDANSYKILEQINAQNWAGSEFCRVLQNKESKNS